ncbi:hypothetical protein E2320_011077 [Naja naja]|nr:hypothetical protein E2320_011077 [Naja naja]
MFCTTLLCKKKKPRIERTIDIYPKAMNYSRSSILILLVLRDQVIHVALGFRELHLIHAFAGIPVQESLPPEHGCELLRDPLEELLDCGAVADEGGRHLQASGRNVAHGRLHVVGDPLHKVAAVLVLDVQHLLIHLLHGHSAPEDGCHRQVSAVAGVTGRHHVFGIKHLLCQLRDRQGTILLAAATRQGSKARHEEVQTRERHHVDRQLAKICVQLARETEAGGHSAHGGRHQVVEIAIDMF